MELKESNKIRLFVRVNSNIKNDLNNLIGIRLQKRENVKGSPYLAKFYSSETIIDNVNSVVNNNDQTFSKLVKQIMIDKNITTKDIYKNTLINRKLFSALNVNDDYIPSRETAIMYCLGLKLNYEESKNLMNLAGYAFNEYSNFDRIIKYFIDNGIYNIDKLNDALYYYTRKCLGYK